MQDSEEIRGDIKSPIYVYIYIYVCKYLRPAAAIADSSGAYYATIPAAERFLFSSAAALPKFDLSFEWRIVTVCQVCEGHMG